MSQLAIYRASAGSGKTYTLTREFINVLFKNPLNYRSTLAVTFTNKATAEMKSRILKELYKMSIGEKTEFLRQQATWMSSEKKAMERAELLLHLLLHDYSRFSVMTIDSFFQRIIRSFIQELGLHSGYKIELNSYRILNQAIDRLITKLSLPEKKELRQWLMNHTFEKMDDGGSWNIKNELLNLGREITGEEFQSFDQSYINIISNKTLMNEYKQLVDKDINSFDQKMTEYSKRVKSLLINHNLTWDDFHGKSRSPFRYFEKIIDTKNYDISKSLIEMVDNPDKWPSDKKNSVKCNSVLEIYNGGLNDILKETIQTVSIQLPYYQTACAIIKNINSLGIIADIVLEMNELLKEDNQYLLSNSNRLLNQIIDNNDTPFIYEKAGVKFNQFLIDEFQDTSELQWNNFKPLINNSLSQNGFSLVVGDVKQAIYRWRNSDWRLLAHKVETQFGAFGVEKNTLNINYRSSQNIIQFNNALFKAASSYMQEIYDQINSSNEDNENHSDKTIELAYEDVAQEIPQNKSSFNGYVRIDFFNQSINKADFDQQALSSLKTDINQLIEKGYRYKDICILVRSSKDASLVVDYLMKGDSVDDLIPVISNEVLKLSKSIAVQLIIHQLVIILNPNSDIEKKFIEIYQSKSFLNKTNRNIDLSAFDKGTLTNLEFITKKGLPLVDLIEFIAQKLPSELLLNEGGYIQSFIAIVDEYIQNNKADLGAFVEWWNEFGIEKSIILPDEQDAIMIQTIHKSKGLEYKFVLMPFANWDFNNSQHPPLLWCEDPYKVIGNTPVQYRKELLNSLFKDRYIHESLQIYIDNLNLLYVAFTRAQKGLIVYAREPKDTVKSISDVIYESVTRLPFDELSKVDDIKWEGNTFSMGTLLENSEKGNVIQTDTAKNNDPFDAITCELPTISSFNYQNRIKIVKDSEGLVDSHSQRNEGKIMHLLFENIQTISDLPNALTKLVEVGIINNSEIDLLTKKVMDKLQNPMVKNWFREGLRVLNERTILLDGQAIRPDRVIIEDQVVTIIDFKFGELHQPSHVKQVQNYINQIRLMGYSKIEGFLWYFNENEIVPVKTSSQLSLF